MRSLAIAVAIGALCQSASAARAYVQNRCNFPTYIHPTGPAGNPGTIQLAANNGVYSEPLTGSGNTIFAGSTSALPHPMQFDFSATDYTYYDASIKNNDPFLSYGFSVLPGDSCHVIHCPPNNNYCSDVFNPSGNTNAVWTCPTNFDITFVLCG